MSFFSQLFLGGKAAESVADTLNTSAKGIFSLADNAFYTDQEKSAASQKAMDAYIDVYKATMNESTGTAEARRWFLQMITNYILLMATLCILAKWFDRSDLALTIMEVVKDFYIGEAFVAAVSFYFLTHVVKGLQKNSG